MLLKTMVWILCLFFSLSISQIFSHQRNWHKNYQEPNVYFLTLKNIYSCSAFGSSYFFLTVSLVRENIRGLRENLKTQNPYPGNSTAKQIMCINDDLCFIWSFKDNCVIVLRLDDDDGSETTCIKLIPTDTPLFDVEKITVSNTGRWICVWGSRG